MILELQRMYEIQEVKVFRLVEVRTNGETRKESFVGSFNSMEEAEEYRDMLKVLDRVG